MIKITNKIETKVVTQGAYENFYKSLGFEPVDSKQETKKEETKEIVVPEVKEKKVIQEDEIVEEKSLKNDRYNSKRK